MYVLVDMEWISNQHRNYGKTPTIQSFPVMLQGSCISGRSKLGRSKLGKKEWKGGSMPFAQLMAVLPLRDVACSLRVPSNSNGLKCNKDENETVIAHRSDCGLFCPKIERSNLL